MARLYCRWRRVVLCVCTLFTSLVLLFLYVGILVTMGMVDTTTSGTDRDHFIAPGASRNNGYAPCSQTFWQNNQHGNAFWNNLQLVVDYRFNPIMSLHNSSRSCNKRTFYESVRRQSFSKVKGMLNSDELPEMLQDFVSSMHRRDYSTLIQPNGLCGAGATDEKEAPLLLLAIKSTDLNFENRQAIRETWGQAGWVSGQNSKRKGSGGYVRRIFLMASNGQPPSSELLAESTLYGDILQWDFKDTFFNLSLKDVLLWKWFSRYCSRTRFVFKGDDDVFVNTVKMITYLRDQLQRPQAEKRMKTFMVGYVIGGTSPIRDDSSKYFIPDNFYTGVYPAYPCGGGFLYSGVLAKRLYQVSKRVHLFPIDDAYIGMCMIRLNIFPIHHPAFLIYGFPGKDEEAQCSYHTMLMIHKRSPSEMPDLWAHLRKTEEECWDAPLRNVYIAQHL
uniref:N-acetyllactosaminide beta-1,3-N-acetylglucosaminyltransferase 2 isoform X1 n=1 Tax=Solea senegalensis TaxID=28829 RepID=UPI001CD8D0E1|nr:N-acetyllactosaminide beta-1,3-N-acetylglucosaminyltransferase 2 isoform X1 [Solea senegalensis]